MLSIQGWWACLRNADSVRFSSTSRSTTRTTIGRGRISTARRSQCRNCSISLDWTPTLLTSPAMPWHSTLMTSKSRRCLWVLLIVFSLYCSNCWFFCGHYTGQSALASTYTLTDITRAILSHKYATLSCKKITYAATVELHAVTLSCKQTRFLYHFSRFTILLHKQTSTMAKLFHI